MKLKTRDEFGRRCCVLSFKKPSGIIRVRVPRTVRVKKSTLLCAMALLVFVVAMIL